MIMKLDEMTKEEASSAFNLPETAVLDEISDISVDEHRNRYEFTARFSQNHGANLRHYVQVTHNPRYGLFVRTTETNFRDSQDVIDEKKARSIPYSRIATSWKSETSFDKLYRDLSIILSQEDNQIE